jgi:uncharacterized protein (DUF58 family)
MLVSSVAITGAVLGVDTHQTVAYKVAAFATGLLFMSVMIALLLRDRYRITRHLPRVATAGAPFSYRVTIKNLDNRWRDALTLVEDVLIPQPGVADMRSRFRYPTYRRWRRMIEARRLLRVAEQPVEPIRPLGTLEVAMQGEALRRGSQHFRGISITRRDPLSLFKAFFPTTQPDNLLVLPRRYRLPPIALPGMRRYQPGGVVLAGSVGNSEEFVGLRDYRPGDPLQRIHWKSFARVGVPVVREYQDEYFERHALVLDTFGHGHDETICEEAVSIVASYACTVTTQECLLDLVFVGTEAHVYTAGRGQLSAGNLLEILAGVQPAPARDFSVLRHAVLGRRHTMSGCIVVLVHWDEPRRAMLEELRAGGVQVLALLVAHERPANLPADIRLLRPDHVEEDFAAP